LGVGSTFGSRPMCRAWRAGPRVKGVDGATAIGRIGGLNKAVVEGVEGCRPDSNLWPLLTGSRWRRWGGAASFVSLRVPARPNLLLRGLRGCWVCLARAQVHGRHSGADAGHVEGRGGLGGGGLLRWRAVGRGWLTGQAVSICCGQIRWMLVSRVG